LTSAEIEILEKGGFDPASEQTIIWLSETPSALACRTRRWWSDFGRHKVRWLMNCCLLPGLFCFDFTEVEKTATVPYGENRDQVRV
jgi:hypothetical protein